MTAETKPDKVTAAQWRRSIVIASLLAALIVPSIYFLLFRSARVFEYDFRSLHLTGIILYAGVRAFSAIDTHEVCESYQVRTCHRLRKYDGFLMCNVGVCLTIACAG